jgi:hypothetical protein
VEIDQVVEQVLGVRGLVVAAESRAVNVPLAKHAELAVRNDNRMSIRIIVQDAVRPVNDIR